MDGFGIYTDMDDLSLFGVLNFKIFIFIGYWSQLLYFLLSNKCYILKCFLNLSSISFGLYSVFTSLAIISLAVTNCKAA